MIIEASTTIKRYNFAQFDVGLKGSQAPSFDMKPRSYFRAPTREIDDDYKIPTVALPLLKTSTSGNWNTVTFSPNEVFSQRTKTNNYKYKRWHFIRFIGDMDVSQIKVGNKKFLKE